GGGIPQELALFVVQFPPRRFRQVRDLGRLVPARGDRGEHLLLVAVSDRRLGGGGLERPVALLIHVDGDEAPHGEIDDRDGQVRGCERLIHEHRRGGGADLRRWFEADGKVLLPRRGRRRRRARLIGDHPRRYALVGLVTLLLPSEHGNDDREHEDDRPCRLGDLRSAHRWGAGGEDLGGREGAGFVLHGDGEEATGVHGVLREDGGVALNLRGVALLVTCGDAGVARGL